MAAVDSRKEIGGFGSLQAPFMDPSVIPADSLDSDIKSLYLKITAASGHGVNHSDEVLKWAEFAETFPVALDACFENLKRLNDELSGKSVLLGNGLKPSEADAIVFSVIHSSLINLPDATKEKLPHVLRWMDYIQVTKSAGAVEADLKSNKTEQSIKSVNKSEADTNKDKNRAEGKSAGDKEPAKAKAEPTKAKAKPAEKEVAQKDNEVSVSLLNIQVGVIRKAWKHPSADSLLVEEIDVGEAKLRQVVSGLAKYLSPEELTVMSYALQMKVHHCGGLLPPEGAKIGERVSFSGIDGKPEDVLTQKKKQLEKITPHLFTDDKGVATFKGIPFMTSGGPCTSSISRATIK
ncbi:tRNA-binding domain [Sesbania bispinosa]|nr:tRNA-binding domain [Sesbania bispinosa]